jgi:CHRD domain
MNRFFGFALLIAAALVAVAVASAAQPPATTFVAVLTAADEVPQCAAATDASRGHFTAHVVDEATGMVEYKVVANNLPGVLVAGHIHFAPVGVPGPVVQPLAIVVGADNGVVADGSFTNPALVGAMRANPQNYYVNLHTSVCGPGVIRGQLDEGGPSNN